jgi:hypothetical protein
MMGPIGVQISKNTLFSMPENRKAILMGQLYKKDILKKARQLKADFCIVQESAFLITIDICSYYNNHVTIY